MNQQKTVIVVGAGIVGASIAWHLTKAGARVTVIAGSNQGGVATPCSFGWINASADNPLPYFHLRMHSMREWKRLKADIPAIPLDWCGGLFWDLTPAGRDIFMAEHGSWGYGIRCVDRAEIARLEPNVADLPEWALHVAEEGAAEPVASALALLADARRRGASIRTGVTVTTLVRSGHIVAAVETSQGRFEADEIVIAAGAGSPALLAAVGVVLPMDAPAGLLVHSRPYRRLLNGIIIGDKVNIRQTAEGRIIGGSSFAGSPPGDDPNETARALFDRIKATLHGAEGLELDYHTIGYRPLPKDKFPVIGRPAGHDGLYIAAMHSGVTMAAAVGLFAAEELLSGSRDPLLQPYGPDRFA